MGSRRAGQKRYGVSWLTNGECLEPKFHRWRRECSSSMNAVCHAQQTCHLRKESLRLVDRQNLAGLDLDSSWRDQDLRRWASRLDSSQARGSSLRSWRRWASRLDSSQARGSSLRGWRRWASRLDSSQARGFEALRGWRRWMLREECRQRRVSLSSTRAGPSSTRSAKYDVRGRMKSGGSQRPGREDRKQSDCSAVTWRGCPPGQALQSWALRARCRCPRCKQKHERASKQRDSSKSKNLRESSDKLLLRRARAALFEAGPPLIRRQVCRELALYEC
jgi:hypothetical protein